MGRPAHSPCEVESGSLSRYRPLEIRTISETDALWDYVAARRDLSVYHKRPWKELVETVFGHESKYLAALENSRVVDVIPAFLVRSLFAGKRIVSTPYEGCFGGFSSRDPEVCRALVEHLERAGRRNRVSHVEIRSQSRLPELPPLGYQELSPLLISRVDLIGLEANWNRLSTNHRRNVGIAQKKNVRVKTADSAEQMRCFYEIVAQHYHRLGVPFPAAVYFDEIWNRMVLQDHARLLIAEVDERIVGGHLLFLSGHDLISKYSAVRSEDRRHKLNVSYALFWEAIRYGNDQHFKRFNLGITGFRNPGLLDFKQRFGATTTPVYFYFKMFRGKAPDYAAHYDGHSLAKKLWRLAPRRVVDYVGHKINKWLC